MNGRVYLQSLNMPVFVVALLALWYCSIAAGNVGPAEEGCECLDYDNVQDSHCDASELLCVSGRV